EVTELRARAALAAARASSGAERDRLVAFAEQQIEKIGKEGSGWTNAVTTLRRASAREIRGDKDGAIRELRSAIAACDEAQLGAHAAAARMRLGALLDGEEGTALRETALSFLMTEEVKKPEAFVALYAP
ncbi:MAG: hypothetical protein AB7L94_27900, partial [Kofleriaceae bacterium]